MAALVSLAARADRLPMETLTKKALDQAETAQAVLHRALTRHVFPEAAKDRI